jgi:hypothetical protein
LLLFLIFAFDFRETRNQKLETTTVIPNSPEHRDGDEGRCLCF